VKTGQNPAAKQAVSPAIAVPVSLVVCYAAWLKARRGKRPSANQLAFEVRWLDRLLELKTVLRAGRWQPARTVSFVVTHPKTREIHAPDFADRVVHHLLVERLEKLYEPIFIHDSYANRKGRGSHAAVDRLQQFMRSRNGQGWYLQLDIHNYFNTIHRPTLYRMVCKHLEQCERRGILPGAHALALRSLCHKLLANKVAARVRDPVAAALVPPHKRLANAAPGCGLPVGNLSSQFFANVYLNALDQFVKHTLKCRHYVRYVDDFVLLADDADQLRVWQTQIDAFLANTLALRCKEAVILQPLCQGVDFLGYRVFAGHRRVRPRVVAHCRAKLRDWAARHVRTGEADTFINADNSLKQNSSFPLAGGRLGWGLVRWNSHISTPSLALPLQGGGDNRSFSPREKVGTRDDRNDAAANALAHLQAMLGSYWGHFAHAQSVRLRHALFEQFDWLKQLFILHADGQISPRWVLQGANFAGQVAALKAGWSQAGVTTPARKSLENCLHPPGARTSARPLVQCLIQKGNRWLWLAQPELSRPELSRPEQEFDELAIHRLTASLRRQGIAYVVAHQTGWLRHGTRRREVREWFSPHAAVS